jgi:uncharacterized protein YjiS (DUF1127 family)
MSETAKGAIAIRMPAGTWEPKQFVITAGASMRQLRESARCINRLEQYSQWALGDIGLALEEQRRTEVEQEIAALIRQAEAIDTTEADAGQHRGRILAKAERIKKEPLEQLTALATVIGIDKGLWRECIELSRDWPPPDRNPNLSPHHHRIAIRAARKETTRGPNQPGGGAKPDPEAIRFKARVWLAHADPSDTNGSKLRRAINVALRTSAPPTHTLEPDPYRALTAADEWAVTYRRQAGKLTNGQRTRMLTLMKGILDLADTLRD